eukprot:scaffold617500_cov18-Prasinocladus_malaysianus.AAC.2
MMHCPTISVHFHALHKYGEKASSLEGYKRVSRYRDYPSITYSKGNCQSARLGVNGVVCAERLSQTTGQMQTCALHMEYFRTSTTCVIVCGTVAAAFVSLYGFD